MNKKIAILQSNYIPWKGYFDIINMVDTFVLFDDMQYTKRDWRNRNKIITKDGLKWLSIPVETKGKFEQKIEETKISDKKWAKNHWMTIKSNYSKAKYFKEYEDIFENFYLTNSDEYLSQINYKLITIICDILEIKTKIIFSNTLSTEGNKNDRLINICNELNGGTYLSGPAAKSYLDEELFYKNNIKVEWMNYSGYPEYQQLSSNFEHGVSIIDLIFNLGKESKKYLKSHA
ncbi:WbqC family protein [Flammeovirga sp. MY04]|uniref:WbqC family protein n=1 Tax=Flammeovirga sp. MY04 TaxID=1191459 RepID=UPI000806390B|nr:WbqC family protein [Flammeovirga sp. MY04]ANQ50220.1 WbqC family protein [Flammeovirga sp. MY04]